MSERYIAAVEISSSKIIVSIGKTSVEGQLEVVAMEEESTLDVVKYGIIQNPEETSIRVSRLLSRLENRPEVSPRKIKSVFVGLSGRSLKSITTEVSLNLPEDTEITEDLIRRLREDAKRKAIDNTLEVIDAVPRIYTVGKTETHSPKGAIGNYIEATYDLIVCRPELKRNLTRTIPDKLGIKIEGFVVTALATGHLILTPDEKRLGCMLVDMGAETTTVSIYKKGGLRYFATLPFGGRNITRDITSLNVLEEKAEQIKQTYGNAMGADIISPSNINGIKQSDINNLVVARSEEIVANIMEQIEYADLKETDLPGGIICIGGSARLQGMLDLLEQQSGLPVRRGQMPGYVHVDESLYTSKNMLQFVSVLYAGATLSKQECLEMPVIEEVPSAGEVPVVEEPIVRGREVKKKRTNRFMEGIARRIGSIFSGPEDDSELME